VDFWDDKERTPEDIRRGAANRLKVLTDVIEHGMTSGPLDAERVAKWHRDCLDGMSFVKGHEGWLGTYRGSEPPSQKIPPIGVGGVRAVLARDVNKEVDKFFAHLDARMKSLSAEIDPNLDKSPEQLGEIAALAGWAHGEWVRIHPFANGSGRTARFIANWILVRFRLRPVIGIRPRPAHPYGPAAAASMRGDHSKITEFILQLLVDPPDKD
jgi:hypothetical protein